MVIKETYLDYLRAVDSRNIVRTPKLKEGVNYKIIEGMEKFVFLFPEVLVYLNRYNGTVGIYIHPSSSTRTFVRDKDGDTEDYLSFIRAKFDVRDEINVTDKTAAEIAKLVRERLNSCLLKYNGKVLSTDKILVRPIHITREMIQKAF